MVSGIALKPAHAALTVNLDKSIYYKGQAVKITITGASATTRLQFQVNDLSGNVITVWEGQATTAGTFSYSWKTSASYESGLYRLIVKDSNTKQVVYKTFTLTTAPAPAPPPPPAEVEEELTPDETADIVENMTSEDAADYIKELTEDYAVKVIEKLNTTSAGAIVESLDSDKASTIVRSLNTTTAARVLEKVTSDKAAEVVDRMNMTDAVPILNTMNVNNTIQVVNKLSTSKAGEFVSQTDTDKAAEVLERIELDRAAGIVGNITVERAAEVVVRMDVNRTVDVIVKVNKTNAARVLETVDVNSSVKILEAAVKKNQSEGVSDIMLEMEEDSVAAIVIQAVEDAGADVVESMKSKDLKKTAKRVEQVIKQKNKVTDPEEAKKVLEKAGRILEKVSTESLVELFIEIANLPETPSSVADVFEVMSQTKVLEVVQLWISQEYYVELANVFGYLTTDTLNDLFGSLEMDDRVVFYPYLSVDTAAIIEAELLPKADLSVSEIIVTKLGPLEYAVTATIENEGNVKADAFAVTFEVDGDEVDEEAGLSLDSGASTTVTFSWEPASKGSYNLKVLVDVADAIDEIGETNNELTKAYGVQLPDLTVEFESIPTDLVEEETYVVSVTASNVGEESASFTLQFTVDGTLADTEDIDNLAAGASLTIEFSWTPDTAGTYSFEVIVDPTDSVVEGDEENNSASTSVTVEAKPTPFPWNYVIIAAVIVAAAVVIYLYSRQKSQSPS